MTFNNPLAEVDCLKHPGALLLTASCWVETALMVGKCGQTSQKPPHRREKNRHLSQCKKTVQSGGRDKGGETVPMNSLHIQEN